MLQHLPICPMLLRIREPSLIPPGIPRVEITSHLLRHLLFPFSHVHTLISILTTVCRTLANPQSLPQALCNPSCIPLKTHHRCAGELGHLRQDLDRGGAVADDPDAFVTVVEAVVPGGGVDFVALEGGDAGDGGPGPVASHILEVVIGLMRCERVGGKAETDSLEWREGCSEFASGFNGGSPSSLPPDFLECKELQE
jgi:hypothetical protein